jgi:hypothetical protein
VEGRRVEMGWKGMVVFEERGAHRHDLVVLGFGLSGFGWHRGGRVVALRGGFMFPGHF